MIDSTYEINSISLKGKFHPNNEDSFRVGSNYIIIADGMGGESSGDIASKITVNRIANDLDSVLNENNGNISIMTLMRDSIMNADAEIATYIEKNPESDGMGATVVIAIFHDNKMHLAWCGDSRCYVYKNGLLTSLSKDHSYVQELIDANEISIEDSFSHPDNNLITRYVGGGNNVCIPEYITYCVSESDILIFCSDGLSGYCRNEEICYTIASNNHPNALPKELLDLSIQNGSEDDITVVTLHRRSNCKKVSYTSFFHFFKKK